MYSDYALDPIHLLALGRKDWPPNLSIGSERHAASQDYAVNQHVLNQARAKTQESR
jgi:hypothetical protein